MNRAILVASVALAGGFLGATLATSGALLYVLGYGALGCLALTAWEETRAPQAVTERSAATRLPEPQERPAH